ncbi:hypothetical protein HZH66_001413 [Vespula vulgaris]|uniref:Uncharacterized protein n=1 Tax=Vespula vulgaris TaxID=7454 RepID=A0A834NK95_VESVU|nr:hypothetical protein HZH66_001413 [Vespula vulgaris]
MWSNGGMDGGLVASGAQRSVITFDEERENTCSVTFFFVLYISEDSRCPGPTLSHGRSFHFSPMRRLLKYSNRHLVASLAQTKPAPLR